jgi:hypothetical protein
MAGSGDLPSGTCSSAAIAKKPPTAFWAERVLPSGPVEREALARLAVSCLSEIVSDMKGPSGPLVARGVG